MCWTPDNDKCPRCHLVFIARNQKLCARCEDFGRYDPHSTYQVPMPLKGA